MAPSPSDLSAHAAAYLPKYMVPQLWVCVESLPLTPNGKLDRKAMPRPDAAPAGADRVFEPPQSSVEIKLAEIWSEVLQVGKVGVCDNFFDLGGHSLPAVRLVARVRSAFGVKLRIAALVEAPTLREFARLISRLEAPDPERHIARISPRARKRPLSRSKTA